MDLFIAARSGQIEELKKLLQKGFFINQKNEKGHSPLMLACYNGQYDAAQFLIESGADVNSIDENSNSILMGVAFKGHSSIFDLLIKAGADLDYKNFKKQTAMDLAIMFGRRDLIFKINQLQDSSRSGGRIEQIKTWVQKAF